MRKCIRALTFTGVLLLGTMAMSVQARADINEHEQNLISFASAIHEYNGKQYKATDAALSKLRSYLDQSDQNLTADQVSDAKNQFYSKIPQGIEEGYMVQVGGGNGGGGTVTPPTVTIVDPNNNIVEVPAPDTTTPDTTTTPTTDVTTMVDTLVVAGAATTPSADASIAPKSNAVKIDKAKKKTTNKTTNKKVTESGTDDGADTTDADQNAADAQSQEDLTASAASDVETIDKEVNLASAQDTQDQSPVVKGTIVESQNAAIQVPFYKNTTFLLIAGFVAAAIIIISIAGAIIYNVTKNDPFGNL